MKGGAAVLAAPALAQVNLLPGDVRQARALGTVKRWLLATGGVTVLAIGTVAGVAHLQTQIAGSQLAQAEAEFAGLQAEQGPLVEVTQIRAERETLRSALAGAMAPEVLWSDYLGAVTAVTPPGVGLITLDYQGAGPLTAAPEAGDPLVSSGVGTLTFTGLAADLPDTAAWADALESVPGLSDVRLRNTTRAAQGGRFSYTISGTIQVDAGALAHRFDPQSEGTS